MLKLSRISRSIITVAYIALMCVMLFFAVKVQSVFNVKAWQMAIYIVLLAFCVCFYQVLKRRLNDKLKYRSIIHIYRYVYLAVVLIVSRVIMIFCLKDTTSIFVAGEDKSLASGILSGLIDLTGQTKYAAVILNTVIVCISSIVIKRIMLNLLDNDAVATTCSILYILAPTSLALCLEYNSNIFNTLFVLAGILLIMKIYDQITQYGMKHNLYIYLSVMLGAVVVLDILFSGSIVSWIVLTLSMTFFADYVDSIYFDVSKAEYLPKIFKLKKNDKLAIKKSVIVFGIVCVFGGLGIIISSITGLNNVSITVKTNVIQGIYSMLEHVKWQYVIGCAVIIFFEIMSVFMRRTGNAKVSIMQLALIIFGIIAIFYTNAVYNLCIYDAILSICCILSVSNIYYNRNEKVKLLKEKN